MDIVFIICNLFFFIFGLVYGNECKKENDGNVGCPIYKIEPQDGCQTYLNINEGEKDFVFYIKPLSKGNLSVSLHKSYLRGQSSTEIAKQLFSLQLKDINKWQKIKIRRDKVRKAVCFFGCFINTYHLDINDQPYLYIDQNVEAGNEIRVQTVSSLWGISCDPRHHETTVEPQTLTHLATDLLSSSQPSSLTPQSPRIDNIGILESLTHDIPVWQLALVTSATLLLILIAVLVAVIMISTHKRTNHGPVLILPTDHQSRLSRHMSENSLYESYDNPCMKENPVLHVMSPAAGTGWENAVGFEGKGWHAFQYQRRGSAHDSENSLYIGFT